jgi:hypothetical protein
VNYEIAAAMIAGSSSAGDWARAWPSVTAQPFIRVVFISVVFAMVTKLLWEQFAAALIAFRHESAGKGRTAYLPAHLPLPMLTASMSTIQSTAQGRQFPKFDLSRLLGTVFKPTFGRTICILIDLPDLAEAKDYAFLKNPARAVQKRAHTRYFLSRA